MGDQHYLIKIMKKKKIKYILITMFLLQFGVAKFDKNKLNSVETVEKNSLPTADDLKDAKDQEKSH